MNPECQHNQEALTSSDTFSSEHIASCRDCSSFRAMLRTLEPPAGLLAMTMARLDPTLLSRAALRRSLFLRLSLAGAVSLPVILGLNAALVWSVYMTLTRIVPMEAAAAGATLVATSLLLALSLAYGSLPLLASWGQKLRARTA